MNTDVENQTYLFIRTEVVTEININLRNLKRTLIKDHRSDQNDENNNKKKVYTTLVIDKNTRNQTAMKKIICIREEYLQPYN